MLNEYANDPINNCDLKEYLQLTANVFDTKKDK